MAAIQVLILAAGAGSRFRAAGGGDKLQAPLPGTAGLSVLQATLRTWQATGLPCLAVVSSASPWRAELARAEGVDVLSLDTTGMGDSLAAAVQATRNAAGWLVALGDMPCVMTATAHQLLERYRPDRIVVPIHQGRRGHPVLFGRNYAAALSALGGDEGAKRLLRLGSVLELEVADAGIQLDVDTPADLARLASVSPELPQFAVLPTEVKGCSGRHS